MGQTFSNDRPRKLTQSPWRRSRRTGYERKPDSELPGYAIRHRQPFDAGNLHGRLGSCPPGWAAEDLTSEQRASLARADYVVLSYETPIAWITGDEAVMPDLRYSITTSMHQTIARVALDVARDWSMERRATQSNLRRTPDRIARQGW